MVAPALTADIVDYDEYLTGERKEGTYSAVWNMVRKAAPILPLKICLGYLRFIFDGIPFPCRFGKPKGASHFCGLAPQGVGELLWHDVGPGGQGLAGLHDGARRAHW